jgi:hypothetical protein
MAAANTEGSIIEVDRVALKRSVTDPSIVDLSTNVIADSGQMIDPNVSATKGRNWPRCTGCGRKSRAMIGTPCDGIPDRVPVARSYRRTTE